MGAGWLRWGILLSLGGSVCTSALAQAGMLSNPWLERLVGVIRAEWSASSHRAAEAEAEHQPEGEARAAQPQGAQANAGGETPGVDLQRTQQGFGLGADPSMAIPAGGTNAAQDPRAQGSRSSWALAEVTDPWLSAAAAPSLAGAVASAERAPTGEVVEHGWARSGDWAPSRDWVRSVDGIIDPWAKAQPSSVVDAEVRVIVDPWAAM